ncbi:MAG: hypothetical protein C4538_12155, partial [Nitrospiraceae bacterium]
IKGEDENAVSAINNVGTSITGVISDPVFDRLYLLKERPGEIMIVRPFTEGSAALKTVTPPVMGVVAVGDAPRSFILDPEEIKLYVVNRGSNSVSVVDKTARKEEMVIPVGNRPYGIAVFPK